MTIRQVRCGASAGLALACAAVFIRQTAAALQESAFLRATLKDVVGGDHIATQSDLVAVKRFLSTSIRYPVGKESRPLLRAPAREILRSGRGFCGENARVAVLLLNAGGVRANRVYLEGNRWGHVVVEHDWAGGRRLFDAHNDPATVLSDALVGQIDSRRLDQFPNHYGRNPYRRAYRIKLLSRWPALHELRLPAPLTTASERPAVIKAVFALLLGVIAIAAGTFGGGCQPLEE